MHGPGEIFAADTAIETLVHVTNIGTTDTAFTIAVYTRDQFNGRKALEVSAKSSATNSANDPQAVNPGNVATWDRLQKRLERTTGTTIAN